MAKLLKSNEPAAFHVLNEKAAGRCVIVCDHASNLIPQRLKNLGMSEAMRKKHIAWDPGTAEMGRIFSEELNAMALIAGYSRAVIDLNRGEDTDGLIPVVSPEGVISGNSALTAADKKIRINELYKPYHKKAAQLVAKVAKRGQVPFVISLHSFTPVMKGDVRPWHIGILWNRQGKLARKYIKALQKAHPSLVIGDNEPYSLKNNQLQPNTISKLAEPKDLPHIIIEVRQDLVRSKAGAKRMAYLLLEQLYPLLEE